MLACQPIKLHYTNLQGKCDGSPAACAAAMSPPVDLRVLNHATRGGTASATDRSAAATGSRPVRASLGPGARTKPVAVKPRRRRISLCATRPKPGCWLVPRYRPKIEQILGGTRLAGAQQPPVFHQHCPIGEAGHCPVGAARQVLRKTQSAAVGQNADAPTSAVSPTTGPVAWFCSLRIGRRHGILFGPPPAGLREARNAAAP
jgi:hypothetical protein